MEAVMIVLPTLLFSSIIAIPSAIGLIAAVLRLRAGARAAYLQHLAASLAAGGVTLAMLWSSLFGDSLSKSSTAALILVVAPVYAAIAQGLVYFAVGALLRKAAPGRAISLPARLALLLPLLMLAVLAFGLFRMSAKGNDSDFAEKASDTATLQRLLEKSRTGEGDAFAIPFNLAQNPNAPPDMLTALATSEYATVRARVASNPATPPAVVELLRYDCASFVRESVVERLGASNALQPPPAPTGVCPKHWK